MDGRNHGRTDERTERQKLYTPRHTSYAGGIKMSSAAILLGALRVKNVPDCNENNRCMQM